MANPNEDERAQYRRQTHELLQPFLKSKVFAGALAFLLLLIVFLCRVPPEPSWKGQSFSWWVATKEQRTNMAAQADEAMTRMASDAVPFLLYQISRKESGLAERMKHLLSGLPGVNFHCDHGNEEALKGFVALGPLAKSAASRLQQLLLDPEFAYSASMALASVDGTNALPALSTALTNQNVKISRAAFEGLFFLGTNAEPALPLVLEIAQDVNCEIRQTALYYSAFIGTRRPEQVTPVIAAALRTSLPSDCGLLLRALTELGPGAAPALPDVLDMLTNTAYSSISHRIARGRAREALLAIVGTNAFPYLIAAAASQNSFVSAAAIEGLAELGTSSIGAIPLLIEVASHDGDALPRVHAIRALGRIGEHADLVVPALMGNLTHPDEYIAVDSALVIATFGTNAQVAAPLLAQMAEERVLPEYYHGGDAWLQEKLGFHPYLASDPFGFALKQIDPARAANLSKRPKRSGTGNPAPEYR